MGADGGNMRGSLGLQATDEAPPQDLDKFQDTLAAVVSAYTRLGIPSSVTMGGPVKVAPRKGGEEANGRYDKKTNTVWIFYPQVNHIDTTFALAHEIAHRIWNKVVSKQDKEIWTHAINAIGRKLPPEAIEANVGRAARDERGALWFWYKNNVGNDLTRYRQYLRTLNYAPSSFPREYSNSSPDEAWSDVVANMALGRPHLRKLTNKSGSVPLSIARQILDRIIDAKSMNEEEEPAKEKFVYGGAQVDMPEFGSKIMDWVKTNVGRDWIDPIDGVVTEPHITIFHGLLSDDVGPLRSLAKLFGGPITFSLGPLGFFDKPDVDVLYASIDSEDLHKLHLMIGRLPSESGYPSYKPHMTIANLKKGYAAQFRGQQPFVGTLQRNGFVLNRKDGSKEFIPTVSTSDLLASQLSKDILHPEPTGKIESAMNFTRSKLITVEDTFIRSPLYTLSEEDEPTVEPQPEADAPPQEPEPEQEPENQPEIDTIVPVEAVSQTSDEFNAQVQKALGTIPDSLRRLVADAEIKVSTAAMLSDIIDPDGQMAIAWDQVSSAVDMDNKMIMIAESTKDGNGNPVPNLNVEGLVRHAFGHVIDRMAPQFVSEHYHDKLSDLEKFNYAHTSDINRLNQEKQAKLSYYVADGDNSRAELFAECFAALHDGGSVYTIEVMSKYFPAVLKLMKELLTGIEKGQPLANTNDEQPEQQ